MRLSEINCGADVRDEHGEDERVGRELLQVGPCHQRLEHMNMLGLPQPRLGHTLLLISVN